MKTLANALRGLFSRDRALLLSMILMSAALFAFLKLASEVGEGDTMALDRGILLSLRSAADPGVPIGPRWMAEAMTDLTAFGGVTGLVLVSAAVIGYLVVSRQRKAALFVVLATGGGALAGKLLKLAYDRPRPTLVPHLVEVSSASFPSGHALDSAIVYLTLAGLLAQTVADRGARLYLLGAAIFVTLAIGFSRIYLGVHWPSDVAAGWVVGAAWALGCSIAYARVAAPRDYQRH